MKKGISAWHREYLMLVGVKAFPVSERNLIISSKVFILDHETDETVIFMINPKQLFHNVLTKFTIYIRRKKM